MENGDNGLIRTVKKYVKPLSACLLAIAISGYFIHISGQRELTTTEIVMFQVFILLFGFSGSYLFGKQSAKEAAHEIIRPHARSAFRRVLDVYRGLLALVQRVRHAREENQNDQKLSYELENIEFALNDITRTIDSSMEDWRDIVPEEVAEVEENIEDKAETGGGE